MSNGLCEILCGSAAGAAGKIFEYPFDTSKVKVQTQDHVHPRYRGAIDCLIKTFREEGLRGLYRGVSTPIVAAAAENATLFFTFDTSMRALRNSGMGETAKAFVSGMISGAAASLVLTPLELVKCRIQVTTMAGAPQKTIREHFSLVLRENGVLGLWRGHAGTLLREAGGSAAWFGTYHVVSSALARHSGPGAPNGPPAAMQSIVAGAAAGVLYNFSLFPADTVKSRMQTEAVMRRKRMSFWETGQEIVAQKGVRGLYSGCGITCARAAPSSAIIFLAFEQLKQLYRNYV